jgi:hypothetical protein
MDSCCDELALAREYPYDAHLAASVRLQRITEQIHEALPVAMPDSPKAPTKMHVKLFQEKLSSFKNTLPADIQQSGTLLAGDFQLLSDTIFV